MTGLRGTVQLSVSARTSTLTSTLLQVTILDPAQGLAPENLTQTFGLISSLTYQRQIEDRVRLIRCE